MNERRNATSASNAQADSLCPGRFKAQQGLPDIINEDAVFGQQIHAALAKGTAGSLDPQGLDTDQLSIYESCKEIEEKLVREAFGTDYDKVKIFREERLWGKIPPDMLEHSACPDVVYRYGPKGLVIEYKCLPGDIPDSPANLQLRDQVVLAAGAYTLSDIATAIVQPLVTHNPQVCVYEPDDIKKAEAEMQERVRKSHQPNAPRIAGEVQCKFCKAKSICKEYAVWTKSLLPPAVNIFDVPVNQWTPEQCARFCEGLPVATKWLEDCKKAMKDRLRANPAAIPGWNLEPGDTRRPVTDPQELYNRFFAQGGTIEMFLKCVDVTKKDLEAQVRLVTKAKGKGLKAIMDKLLEGVTTDKQNEPSLTKTKS